MPAGAKTSFKFHCPACGRALSSPTRAVGKRARCPQCQVSITIPAMEGMACPPPAAPRPSLSIPAKPAVPAEPPTWRAIVRANREFVPLIECACGVGSGLLVSQDGLVVTNRHVIEGAPLYMLTFYDGSKAKAVTVHTHERRDLAVIRAAIRREKCFDIEKRVADTPHAGDDVLAIGHPRGFAFTATRGIVSETRRRLPDGEYLQTDVAINPGNSGGPLLDQFGRLVGLNTRTQKESQGLGFAIGGREVQDYVLYVLDLLKRRELRYESDEEIARKEKCLTPWDIAKAAVFATGLPHRQAVGGDGPPSLEIKTAAGRVFCVAVGGNIFRVFGAIATGLSKKELKDPELLARLLGWQNELCGPAFELTADALAIGFKRSVEGLDVNEAREAILRVADAIDALHDPIRRYLRGR
jgi:hypothetical protein